MTSPLYTDVVVVGGGTSGSIAAIAAARSGADTLLVERYGFLGGTATFGNPFHGFFNGKGEQVVKGIPEELVQLLVSIEGSPGHLTGFKWGPGTPENLQYSQTPYDHELIKYALLKMNVDAGTRFLLHAVYVGPIIEGNELKGIIVQTKSGRREIYAKVVVDASADGDVAASAGAEFDYGNQEGEVQNVTLLFKLGNVDMERALAALEEGSVLSGKDDWHCKITRGRRLGEDKESVIAFQARVTGDIGGETDPEKAKKGIILAGLMYRPGEYVANLTRTTGINGTSDEDLTRAEVSERIKVFEAVRALHKIPGFEKCYLITTAAQVGVRETRRVVGEYVLTKEDCIDGRKFADSISHGAYPIDIHDPKGGPHWFQFIKDGESYGIPYRCCVPKSIDQLLIAGRAISMTHEALGSVRNQATVMGIGHGVGTAAALAARQGRRPRDLDVNELRQLLVQQGAVV